MSAGEFQQLVSRYHYIRFPEVELCARTFVLAFVPGYYTVLAAQIMTWQFKEYLIV